MDVDYYNLEDWGLLSALCPKCHHRKYYVYDRRERNVELQCDHCGVSWSPYEDEEADE